MVGDKLKTNRMQNALKEQRIKILCVLHPSQFPKTKKENMIVKVRKRGNNWGSWLNLPTSQEESENGNLILPKPKEALKRKKENKIEPPLPSALIIEETPISKALGTLANRAIEAVNKADHELSDWLSGGTLNPNLFLPIRAGKRRMNWEAFDIAAELLAKKVKGQNCTCIYGQPRGGLILAVMLSHKLGLPLTLTPYASMLWCDDIVDTGETFLKMKQKFPKAVYCSLLAKKFHNEVFHVCDYSEKNEWVVFPWETEESTEANR